MLGRPNAAQIISTTVVALALTATGCGADDKANDAEPKPQAAAGEDLGAIKQYLLDHAAALKASTADLASAAEGYRELTAAADYDYAGLLRDKREDVRASVESMQGTWREANPA